MVFVMPDSGRVDSMAYCIKYLYHDRKTLPKLLDELFTRKRSPVTVSVPKFKVESNINLLPLLTKVGAPELIELPGILKSGRILRVGQLRQKAYITVNEA